MNHRALVISGCVLACAGIVALAGMLGGAALALWDASTQAHEPAMYLLRTGFAVAALGLFLAPRAAPSPIWTLARRVAALTLLVSLLASFLAMWAPNAVDLASVDDVRRRLLRLADMASRAVPLLALIASMSAMPERAGATGVPTGAWQRAGSLVVRIEPYVFVVGVTALPLLLALSALVHKEIAWALPIGADTTILGCVGAALRAHGRADMRSFVAWLVVVASMVVGLGMGGYAFGGPLPTPSALGDYAALARTILRDGHVITISCAATLLAWTSLGKKEQAA